jgi:hypothetical protein
MIEYTVIVVITRSIKKDFCPLKIQKYFDCRKAESEEENVS